MTTAARVPTNVPETRELELAALVPHPSHRREDMGDVEALARSIAADGLLQPLVVARDGNVLLMGHRRKRALEQLGRTHAPCQVVEADEAKALELLLAGNALASPPSAWEEADAVVALLKSTGWTARQAARQLGRTLGWVQERAQLVHLEPSVAEKAREEGWDVRLAARVAALPAETQREVNDHERLREEREPPAWRTKDVAAELPNLDNALIDVLGELALDTKSAAWDLDDAELVPEAGACSACPKTSRAAPGLFDEDAPDGAGSGKCLDRACWAGKLKAFVTRIVDEEKSKKNPRRVVAIGWHWERHGGLPEVPGLRAVSGTTSRHRESVPALLVQPSGETKSTYVWGAARKAKQKPKKKAKKAEKGKAEKADPVAELAALKERLGNSRALIAKRRAGWVADHLLDAVLEHEPRAELIPLYVDLVAIVGLPRGYTFLGDVVKKRKPKEDGWPTLVPTEKVLWDALAPELRRNWHMGRGRNAPEAAEAGKRVARTVLTAEDVDQVVAAADEAIPDPKWWARGQADVKRLQKEVRAKKRKAPKKAAKKSKGA